MIAVADIEPVVPVRIRHAAIGEARTNTMSYSLFVEMIAPRFQEIHRLKHLSLKKGVTLRIDYPSY